MLTLLFTGRLDIPDTILTGGRALPETGRRIASIVVPPSTLTDADRLQSLEQTLEASSLTAMDLEIP
jgi:hypothetical protein